MVTNKEIGDAEKALEQLSDAEFIAMNIGNIEDQMKEEGEAGKILLPVIARFRTIYYRLKGLDGK